MAIYERSRKSGKSSYQVKLQDRDGRWTVGTFPTRREAREFEVKLKLRKSSGRNLTVEGSKISVREFFGKWDAETSGLKCSDGWRDTQRQMFRDYVDPLVGSIPLRSVTSADIQRVIKSARDLRRGGQTLVHIYGLLRKLFGDAVESYRFIEESPVLKKFKQAIPTKESRYLQRDEVLRLLRYVQGKQYGLAIWLGVLCGLRVGEVQALTWDNVDLENGLLHIRSTYVRREKCFKDYPKGRRWHSVPLPPEILAMLKETLERGSGKYVIRSPECEFLNYQGYHRMLKRYCREIGVTEIATHGLRHSASELYRANGASKDDLQKLYGHSSSAVTSRYIHDKGEQLSEVSQKIRVLPAGDSNEASQNLPKSAASELDDISRVC